MPTALLAAALATAAAMPPAHPIGQDRLRPPDAVACDRDELTLYAGRVIAYAREATELRLTIATDWDTEERVTLRAADGLEDHMLVRGRRLETSILAARGESSPQVLTKLQAPYRAGCGKPIVQMLPRTSPYS